MSIENRIRFMEARACLDRSGDSELDDNMKDWLLWAARQLRAQTQALEDIAHGRGMFGVDPHEDLTWAIQHAGAALEEQP